jgi:hypothetical protein
MKAARIRIDNDELRLCLGLPQAAKVILLKSIDANTNELLISHDQLPDNQEAPLVKSLSILKALLF